MPAFSSLAFVSSSSIFNTPGRFTSSNASARVGRSNMTISRTPVSPRKFSLPGANCADATLLVANKKVNASMILFIASPFRQRTNIKRPLFRIYIPFLGQQVAWIPSYLLCGQLASWSFQSHGALTRHTSQAHRSTCLCLPSLNLRAISEYIAELIDTLREFVVERD